MLDSHEKQFHIPLSKGDVGKYCILPGDPARCEKIARFLEEPSHLIQNREYNVWEGRLLGEKVTVCSTGIGGPSTAIAVEELVACGAEVLIRVGTCGGISLAVESGDVVIATGAVRQDGTSHEYAPPEFPAVPDARVLFALVRAAEALGYSHRTGVVQSKDSFYGQHSPTRMPTASALLEKWEAWKRLGVLASEMEASTLFTVGASLGVKTGAVFHCIWNQERFDAGLDTAADEKHNTEHAIRVAIEAIGLLIAETK
ncbi:MAG: uridine phosphorylase [Ruminococcaceae bacterium]|nr:uridine phosphorylase [Oscillospiraceae bacterium]